MAHWWIKGLFPANQWIIAHGYKPQAFIIERKSNIIGHWDFIDWWRRPITRHGMHVTLLAGFETGSELYSHLIAMSENKGHLWL